MLNLFAEVVMFLAHSSDSNPHEFGENIDENERVDA